MPHPSGHGRQGGGEIATLANPPRDEAGTAEAAPAASARPPSPDGNPNPRPFPWGRRIANVSFLTFFAGYFLFALSVLGLGAAAYVASKSPGFHDRLHEWAFDETTTGRLAKRVADASHDVESLPSFVLDYAFSVFNLAMAGFLVYLRRNERTARLLSLAMVGTAGVFNLQAHAVYEELPPSTLEAITHDGFHLLAAVAYLLALLLFPDGRMVPRWSIPKVAALYAVAIGLAVPIAFLAPGGSRSVSLIVTFGVLTTETDEQAREIFNKINNSWVDANGISPWPLTKMPW